MYIGKYVLFNVQENHLISTLRLLVSSKIEIICYCYSKIAMIAII